MVDFKVGDNNLPLIITLYDTSNAALDTTGYSASLTISCPAANYRRAGLTVALSGNQATYILNAADWPHPGKYFAELILTNLGTSLTTINTIEYTVGARL